jgi:hypothetical protein
MSAAAQGGTRERFERTVGAIALRSWARRRRRRGGGHRSAPSPSAPRPRRPPPRRPRCTSPTPAWRPHTQNTLKTLPRIAQGTPARDTRPDLLPWSARPRAGPAPARCARCPGLSPAARRHSWSWTRSSCPTGCLKTGFSYPRRSPPAEGGREIHHTRHAAARRAGHSCPRRRVPALDKMFVQNLYTHRDSRHPHVPRHAGVVAVVSAATIGGTTTSRRRRGAAAVRCAGGGGAAGE